MMYGQMTAGSWIYIGSQGIVQGTYETFAEAGRQHYGGNLKGRWILTGGLGGMGGAQPLAAVMAGASCLAVECNPDSIDFRLRTRYLDHDGVPVGDVTAPAPIAVEHVELDGADAEQAAHRLVRERIREPFDLAAGPPLRVTLLRLGEAEHVVSFAFDRLMVSIRGRRRVKVAMDGEISWMDTPLEFKVSDTPLPLVVPVAAPEEGRP